MRNTVIILALTLGGCVSTSEIVPVGKDSFMLTTTARGGGGGGVEGAKAANQYCESRNTHMIIRRMDSNGIPGLGPVNGTLVFSCVAANDPEYQRPNLRHDPNVTIEDRR